MTAGPPDRPTARIERLAAGGDGVGKLADGRTVFVPRSAAGDLVELADLRVHKRFARARLGALREPGPGRVAPRCGHYERDRCGGCQWQHLDPALQRAAKRAVIGDALRRIGKLEVEDPEVVPSDVEFGYRTKITLARGTDGALGLHREGEPGRIFPLDRCELIVPALQEAWDRLRPLRASLPRDLDHLVLRLDRAGQVHVVVETLGQQVWRAEGLAAIGTIWWRPEGGSPRVVAGGDGRTAYPATVFEQVHPVMGDRVRRWAVAEARVGQGDHVWDLYAGIGETSDLLATGGATVQSVEGDRRAVALAERNGPDPRIERLAARVEDVIGSLRPPRTVVTNPPRIGMEERAVDALRRARPERLVYISCDPATLARDVARLGPGYRVRSLKGFDLFPQTSHVETVLTLEIL